MAPDLYPSSKGEPFPVFCLRELPAIFPATQSKPLHWIYDSSEGVIYFALTLDKIAFPQVVRDLGETIDDTGAVWRGARLLSDHEIPLTKCPDDSFLDLLSTEVVRNTWLIGLWCAIAEAADQFGATVQATLEAMPIGGCVQLTTVERTQFNLPILPHQFAACKLPDGSFAPLPGFAWPKLSVLTFCVSDGATLIVSDPTVEP